MKSTSRPVKKKQTGLSSIPATYWLIGIVAVMVALALIVLVGLASKNAILIVEFAEQLREGGKGALEAVVSAAERR